MASKTVRAPKGPLARLLDAALVLAGMWLAGGLAAAAGGTTGLRWLAAALVFPLVPFALLILVSPRLGLQRAAIVISALGAAASAVWWRQGLVAAVTTHARWPLAGSAESETDTAPTSTSTPTPTPTPEPAKRAEAARPIQPDVAPQPRAPDPKDPPNPAIAPRPREADGESRCFRAIVRTEHSDSAYGTTLVDLDGDRRLDAVAIESKQSAEIRVWRGDGAGRFTAAHAQAYEGGGLHFAVLDADRDGKPDLATADHEEATVTLWMGQGDGTFIKGAALATYRSPLGIWSADLEGDGFVDLAVAHYFHVEVLRGGKGGKWRATPWLKLEKEKDRPGTLLTPEGVAAVDLTGDGLLDLVIPKGDVTSIEVWTGRKGGLRRAAAVASCGAPADALAGDVDEDGSVDVLVHCGEGHLELFAGDGKGGLASRGKVGADDVLHTGALVDFNGDGHLDLVAPRIPGGLGAHVYEASGGVLTVHAGDGEGNFTAEQDARGLDGLQHRVVAVVDIDADERLDVVYECFGQSPGGHLGVAFGTGCAGG